MLNVEEELRQAKIYTAEVGLFDPETQDIEVIPYVSLSLTDKLKVKLKAEQASSEFYGVSGDQHLANVELRNKLIYWSVVFGISVEDEAAYKRLTQDYVENYIEHGPIPFDCYENLGLDILTSSGLDNLLPMPEDDEEPQDDGVDTVNIN